MKDENKVKYVKFIKYWYVIQFILNAVTFSLFSWDCFITIPVFLIEIAAFTHFLVLDVVPIVNLILFLVVCFTFKKKSYFKKYLLIGTGSILVLCIVDLIYRTLVLENMGTLSDYRNMFALLFLPVICVAIILFEIGLNKNVAKSK